MAAHSKTEVDITGVPFYRLRASAEDIRSVQEVLRSGWLTTGKVTRRLEDEFCQYVGSKYAVAVNSCTAALHLSLLVAGVGPDSEVITSPYTFVSSAEAIIHAGARPVFVDVEPDSFNIDLKRVPAAVTERTRAIVPIHVAGLPCDLRELAALRRRFRLRVVQDTAHALGAAVGNRRIGSHPDLNCFSFYATKNLTTGEGGMVTTNNRRFSDRLRLLSLHGMSRGAWKRYTAGGSWRYRILDLGYKYNLSDINAALGLAQLRRLEQMQAKRRRIVGWYAFHLRDIEELQLPQEPPGVTHAWHLYIVKLRKGGERARNQVIEALRQKGIGTSVHFIPLHLQPYYRRKYHLAGSAFPHAVRHFGSVISLPLYVDLQEPEVKYISAAFKSIFVGHRHG